MLRKIIRIDEALCNGCGACAAACHEGAIGMVEDKAKLLRDDYCDGLGDCLPACPTGAITFEARECAPYDAAAVRANQAAKNAQPLPCGCPGSHSHAIHHAPAQSPAESRPVQSLLSQWPVQIKLCPVNASYFDGAKLLVAADCTAFAYGNFHNDFIAGHVTLVGCPKLDGVDYAEKLTEILRQNDIQSLTVARMEVPCCGGLEQAVRTALQSCGKLIALQVAVISTDGTRLR